MASLTLTPDPDATPPSVLVEVEATAGRVVSSVTLTRDGVPVLGSALAGFGTATYADYSAPYGRLCNYRAVGVESEQTWPALWSESWSSLASWTGADWSVSAGVASSQVYGATLTRAAASFGKITVTTPNYVRLELLSAAGVVVGSVTCTSSMVIAGTDSATIAAVDDFDAWIVGSALIVSTATQSASVTISAVVTSVRLVSLTADVPSATRYISQTYAVAASGDDVYVADFGGKLIRKFTSAITTEVTNWSATTGWPRGIAVDSAGNVYVTDDSSQLVRKYSSTGTALTSWSTTGEPYGIAVDSTGNVYVTDTTNKLVRKYSSTGTALTSWSTTGDPYGIAVDSAGNVYVTTSVPPSTHTVRKYSSTGTALTSWSSPYSLGVAVDSSGNVYITDFFNRLVRKYSSTGTALTSWSTTGEPYGIAVDSAGNVYVCDKDASRLRKYAHESAAVGSLSTFTTVSVTDTSFDLTATATINSASSWLIHPKTPALSVQIGLGDSSAVLNIEKDGIGDASRETQAGRQRAAGATEDAVFTVGNRSAPSLTVTGYTDTEDAASALKSLFADESAVMLRFPPSWSMPFEERWYSVGTYTEAIIGTGPERRWTLPLTPAATPYVVVQPVWSEAALVLAYPTEAAYIAAFATEYDKLVNNPR